MELRRSLESPINSTLTGNSFDRRESHFPGVLSAGTFKQGVRLKPRFCLLRGGVLLACRPTTAPVSTKGFGGVCGHAPKRIKALSGQRDCV